MLIQIIANQLTFEKKQANVATVIFPICHRYFCALTSLDEDPLNSTYMKNIGRKKEKIVSLTRRLRGVSSL